MGGIGLWGEEFSIPPTQEIVKSIKAKTSSQLQQLKNKTDEQKIRSRIVDIHEKIRLIRENVNKKLGVYANNTVVIYKKEEFVDYIEKAIKNGAIAVDTETNNSLDPTTCKIMGLCIYTDGEKQAYIPINHVDPDTKEKLPNQLTEEDVKEQLLRLDNTKIIMHNAPFDYQVIGYTCDVWLHVDWDTMVASKLLNENEEAKLKVQYTTKIDPSIDKYDITSFFGNIEYSIVPPDVFSLYAATDAFMTYKLYLYQKGIFELPENNRLYKLFIDVEMPIDTIASNMERVGVCIDTDYANRLKESYNRRIAEVDKKIEREVEKMSDAILEWRLTPEANFKPKKKKATKDGNEFDKSKSEQLPTPINVASNTQLAIIMYDVLKLPVVDKDKPRGTDSDILEELVKNNNFTLGSLILEKRGLYKLLSTYIDAIPNQISPRDGRLHAHFNSVGASTGRFSSSSPNLQNIPSNEKTIRMMFRASDGYEMVGGDFSQQEPRLLASMSGDKQLIGAYNAGRDLYATMAATIHHNDYWDNMEHYEDGTPNPEGKKRRSAVKKLTLAILYGMGADSLGVDLNIPREDAQKLIDDFYRGYPIVKKFIDGNIETVHKIGYVEDVMGRRRRLPDAQLPKYTIKYKDGRNTTFNPILGTDMISSKREDSTIKAYSEKLKNARGWREAKSISDEALKEGIVITNNSGFISRAERQSSNARIQGSASTVTKLAMINVANDKELNELGFRLLICVHDELLGECPKENSERVAKRLAEIMIESAKPVCSVKMSVDTYRLFRWYADDFSDYAYKQYQNIIKDGKTKEQAETEILNKYDMVNTSVMESIFNETFDVTSEII